MNYRLNIIDFSLKMPKWMSNNAVLFNKCTLAMVLMIFFDCIFNENDSRKSN